MQRRHRLVRRMWRVVNPVVRPLAAVAPWWVLLEIPGRRTGAPRRTPLAVGRVDAGGMWVVAVHGRGSSWVLNAEAAGTVRYRHRLRWQRATAVIHEWTPDLPAGMGRYARLGLRATAADPLVVQLRPVTEAAATRP